MVSKFETMANKILIAVVLLAMVILCCQIETASGGEMGGHAVRKGNSYSSSLARHRRRFHYHHSRQPRITPKPSNSSDASVQLWRDEDLGPFLLYCLFVSGVILFDILPRIFGKDSVIVVQVAFKGATGQIGRDLDLISDTMDSPVPELRTPRGLQLLLSETVTCLCRYGGESCFSAYSNVNKKWRLAGGWKESFDRTCDVERKKHDAHFYESDCGHETRCKSTCPNHKYAIVTILVAAKCKFELPAINCYSDLESALRSLTSIEHAQIEAVKVLWTSRDDIEDFTSLIRI